MKFISLLFLITLSGCATANIPPPSTTISCPRIKQYSVAQEQAVEKAKQALPKDSPLNGFITDYGQLRSEVRACQSVK